MYFPIEINFIILMLIIIYLILTGIKFQTQVNSRGNERSVLNVTVTGFILQSVLFYCVCRHATGLFRNRCDYLQSIIYNI